MPDPRSRSATAPPATHSDVFGPLQGGERHLWQGQCAVAEYAFDKAASMPRWALPETTQVLVTDHRLVYAYTRTDSPDLEVTSGELRWLWPQHLRVQPGARTAGRAAAAAQIQLVCAASDGTFPALVFAGGDLATVGDADQIANLIRHAIARFRIDNAEQLGLSTPQARMLARLLIGPEFSNYQGGEGQTVTLLGALSVHRPADPHQPADAGHLAEPAPESRPAVAVPAPETRPANEPTPEAHWADQPEPAPETAWEADPEPTPASAWAIEPGPAPASAWDNEPGPAPETAWSGESGLPPETPWENEPAPMSASAWKDRPGPTALSAWGNDPATMPGSAWEDGSGPATERLWSDETDGLLLASLHSDPPLPHDDPRAYPPEPDPGAARLAGADTHELRPASLEAAGARQPDEATTDGLYPASVSGTSLRLPGYRPGLAADEARALQAAAAEEATHLTQPDLASRAADLAARVADLVSAADQQAAADQAARERAAAQQAAAERAAAEQEVDRSEVPTTDLTQRAANVRRAAARFAANAAKGKAGPRRSEHETGSTSRGNRTR